MGYLCTVPSAFNGGMLNSIQTYLFTQNNQKTLFMDQKQCWRWSSEAKEGPYPHTGTSLSRKVNTRQETKPLGVIFHNFSVGNYTAHSKGHLYVHVNTIRQQLGRWGCEGQQTQVCLSAPSQSCETPSQLFNLSHLGVCKLFMFVDRNAPCAGGCQQYS